MGSVQAGAIEELRTRLSGPVIAPDGADYDTARTVFNAMIDRGRR